MFKYYTGVLKNAKEIDDWLNSFDKKIMEDNPMIVGYVGFNDHIIITVRAFENEKVDLTKINGKTRKEN